MDIATKLKENRKQTGFTQEEIAQKLHVSRQTVSNWETGKSIPDIYNLVELSNIYDISLDNLVKEDEIVMKRIKKDDKDKKVIDKGITVGAVGTIIFVASVILYQLNGMSYLVAMIAGFGISFSLTPFFTKVVLDKFRKEPFENRNKEKELKTLIKFCIGLGVFSLLIGLIGEKLLNHSNLIVIFQTIRGFGVGITPTALIALFIVKVVYHIKNNKIDKA